MTPAFTRLAWSWCRFNDLGVDNLYDALALRCRVFILEQGAFLDTDGVDRDCWHLLGRAGGNSGHNGNSGNTGALLAYLRVVDPGIKYAEPSIGRVITALECRGTGVGRVLMAEGMARCRAVWPKRGVRISAQQRLQKFYAGLGFDAVGEPYTEDGIPHVEMLLPPAPPDT